MPCRRKLSTQKGDGRAAIGRGGACGRPSGGAGRVVGASVRGGARGFWKGYGHVARVPRGDAVRVAMAAGPRGVGVRRCRCSRAGLGRLAAGAALRTGLARRCESWEGELTGRGRRGSVLRDGRGSARDVLDIISKAEATRKRFI